MKRFTKVAVCLLFGLAFTSPATSQDLTAEEKAAKENIFEELTAEHVTEFKALRQECPDAPPLTNEEILANVDRSSTWKCWRLKFTTCVPSKTLGVKRECENTVVIANETVTDALKNLLKAAVIPAVAAERGYKTK